jgi:hypothetical protein
MTPVWCWWAGKLPRLLCCVCVRGMGGLRVSGVESQFNPILPQLGRPSRISVAWDVYGSWRMGVVRWVGVGWKGLSWHWFGEVPERSWFRCSAVRRCQRQRRLSSPSARTTSRWQFPLNLAHPWRGVGRFSLSRCFLCSHPGNGWPSGLWGGVSV